MDSKTKLRGQDQGRDPLLGIKRDTAGIEPWESYFRHVKGLVHPELVQVVRIFDANQVSRVLDFCCGNGRNSIYLAESGFDVYGFDRSYAGIRDAENELRRQSLTAHLRVLDMIDSLPYSDGFFDAIIAVRAMYHADLPTIRKLIAEVARITRSGGYLYLNGASYEQYLKHKNMGWSFEELGQRTFRHLSGDFEGHVYHYFNREELIEEFGKYFDIETLTFSNRVYDLLARRV